MEFGLYCCTLKFSVHSSLAAASCCFPPLIQTNNWFPATSFIIPIITPLDLGPTKSRPEPSGHRLDQSRVDSVPDRHETCYNVVAMR